ncbi:MAG: TrmH family RNA methyltransferase [Cyanobacteriota bacterium]
MDSSAGVLTSRRNPLVRRLRQLHSASGRREQGLLLLEGTHLVQEALRLGLTPHHLLWTDAWCQRHPQLVRAMPLAVRPIRVSAELLAAVATTDHPDGVVLTLPPPAPAGGEESFVLALDRLQDPGNLGTLMRTALAAGVEALWLGAGADPLQPKVLRASAGAALALPLLRVDGAALERRLRALAQAGSQLVAAVVATASEADGRQSPVVPYWQLDWCRPTALLLGQEGSGLAPELQALATHRVTIPHSPAVESLNVAVAAAPLLLERWRQQLQAANHPAQQR